MASLVLIGVSVQVLAVCLVFRRLRRHVYSHIGAFFVFAAFAFHGLTEVFQAFVGEQRDRARMDHEHVEEFVFVVGLAILVFAVVYVCAVRPREVDRVPQAPSWRLFAVGVGVPYLMTISGVTGYWVAGLTQAFFVMSAAILSFTVAQRYRISWLLVIVAQTFGLALLGSRNQMLAGALLCLMLVSRYGTRREVRLDGVVARRNRRRRVLATLAVASAVFALITVARAFVGRQAFVDQATLASRIDGLTLRGNRSGGKNVSFAHSVAHRLDGNLFGGFVRAAESDVERPGLTTLKNNLVLMVPSFVFPEKLNRDIEARSEEYYLSRHYNMPDDIDYLPTHLGTIYAYYGWPFLYLAAAGLAFALARLDRWLHRTAHPAALVVTTSVGLSVFFYEKAMLTYFLQARAAIAILALWSATRFLDKAARNSEHPHRSPVGVARG